MEAFKVTVDDITLSLPDKSRCWKVSVVYSCGCPVLDRGSCLVRNKVIHIKKNDHFGPCLRCVTTTATYKLREQCDRCELEDAHFDGAYNP
ncbi:hypothetical protein F4778DRAFT_725963 [Xylariomycetidae sp. FL2044]|nr:hypothetical protein F4778DRAFT_725963 [Xylariomycetidae sp. FL2044]